jgi:hypothetical protein
MSILDDKTDHDDDDTRPAYYGGPDDPHEPVKVIDRVGLGPGFYYGSALKYLQRAGKKAGEEERDLKKIRWYLANGVSLGYQVPTYMRIEGASEVALAWRPDGPQELRDAIFHLLQGFPEVALEKLDGLD